MNEHSLFSRRGFLKAAGGSGCYLFFPPTPNFLGISTISVGQTRQYFGGADYAGLANAFFGTYLAPLRTAL
jgi:hypothetical protein